MKTKIKNLKVILIMGIALFAGFTNSIAQKEETKTKDDSIRFSLGNYKVLMIKDTTYFKKRDTTKDKDKFRTFWTGFGLGVNGYLNTNNEIKVPLGYDFLELNYPKSINVSLNFLFITLTRTFASFTLLTVYVSGNKYPSAF